MIINLFYTLVTVFYHFYLNFLIYVCMLLLLSTRNTLLYFIQFLHLFHKIIVNSVQQIFKYYQTQLLKYQDLFCYQLKS